MVGNKNVISADLEKDHHLQKSWYLGYYKTDFNQSFTEMIQLGLATKASLQLTFKMYVKVTHHRVISAIIKPNETNFSSRMMIPLPGLLRLGAGLHFFTQDNCLLHMAAPHKLAIYL